MIIFIPGYWLLFGRLVQVNMFFKDRMLLRLYYIKRKRRKTFGKSATNQELSKQNRTVMKGDYRLRSDMSIILCKQNARKGKGIEAKLNMFTFHSRAVG